MGMRLPTCRYRTNELPGGRHGCVSPLLNIGDRGVPDGWCYSCHVRNREVSGRRAAVLAGSAGGIRHLAYHLYPAGDQWRPNIDALRQRIALFNGRRLMAVATGPETASFGEVQSELEDLHVEVLEVPNDATMREMSSYPLLMRHLSMYTGLQDCHWYGHSKGVSSVAWAPGSIRWREAMYEAQLDHWPLIGRILQSSAAVGQFVRPRHIVTGTTCAWHYSGTFSWRRHVDLYSRNWDSYDQCWCGSESHLGRILDQSEATCLYGQHCEGGLGLYLAETWDGGMTAQRLTWLAQVVADRQAPLLLTVILTAARQRDLVHEAIASVQAQTSTEWECLVVDAGVLAAEGAYDRYAGDARIRVVTTGESPADAARCCMQGRAINGAMNSGQVRGDLVLHLSDDDVLAPGAVAAFLSAARAADTQSAWYGPVLREEYLPEQGSVRLGTINVHGVISPSHAGISRTDGMQVCCRRSAWRAWPEARHLAPLADGVWLDTVAADTPIYPIAATIGTHRHTPLSTFTGPAQRN